MRSGAISDRSEANAESAMAETASCYEVCPLFAFVAARSSLEGSAMRHQIRIAALAAALSLCGAVSVRAQSADDHKPGGLNKVAHDISNTSKKAGRDTKAEIKRDASKAHGALKE